MAKLCLRFEGTTLKEFPLDRGVTTVGRLPDNTIQIDNPAVSGHHAKIYWEGGDFFVEDNDSLNGTFINDQRLKKRVLQDNDNILIGKHTLNFKAEPQQAVAPAASAGLKPALPALDATAMLDTKKARELMAQASAKMNIGGAHAASTPAPAREPEPVTSKVRVGVLTVVSGNTDERVYVLTGKMTVIGKSDMASIRLKGWFAPKIAAAINHRDDKYFIAASGSKQKIKVNGNTVAGQWQLNPGDNITVWKLHMTFDYN